MESLLAKIEGEWKAEVPSWTQCSSGRSVVCPDEWAAEVEPINCSHCWKGIYSGVTLGDDYYNANKDIIGKLLAQGGIRLAAILNEVYG